MYNNGQIIIGDADGKKISILPGMANRHGLITGATGTGKTTTVRVLAESFSDAGVPVFLADVKGDLSGLCRPGQPTQGTMSRVDDMELSKLGFSLTGYPTVFWDIYGKNGIPLRTTISEMGPVLLSRIMDLNTTQSELLTVIFQIADDNNLLLIDTKDLKSMLQYVSAHSAELSTTYGNMSKQSLSAILRHVVALEGTGGREFFFDPALNIADWFTTDPAGRGCIQLLDCRELIQDGILYSAFLLWMLSELYETLPEVGDRERPRIVFFFDEAHLLFNGISKSLEAKIVQIIKLIRSKGVGVFFISQSPSDIPNEILGQLGNKIQHALRAYTPNDEKAIKAAANSFRTNPAFDTKEVLQNLGTGEALISVLDEAGIPTIVEKCRVLPPQSLSTPITDEEKRIETVNSNYYLKYHEAVDRDSAYEFLTRLTEKEVLEKAEAAAAAEREKALAKERAENEKKLAKLEAQVQRDYARQQAAAQRAYQQAYEKQLREQQKAQEKANRERQRLIEKSMNSVGGTVGRELGNTIGKTLGGSFGKKVGGNLGSTIGRNLFGTMFKN